MTDPARLLHTRLDSASRRAIEAAASDEPPDHAKAEIWGSIALALPATGVLLGVTTATSAATASSNLAATGAATASSNLAAGATALGATTLGTSAATTGLSLIAGKAVALGLGIGLAVHVATGVIEREPASRPVAASASSKALAQDAVLAVRPPAASQATADLARPVTDSTPSAPQLPVLAAQPGASTRLAQSASVELARPSEQGVTDVAEPPPSAPDEEPSDELRQESSLLVRARQALAAAQPAVAMAYVHQHRQRFATGKLLQEREALEVHCLAKLGQSAEARVRAAAFLARYPTSPHREKMRSIAGQ